MNKKRLAIWIGIYMGIIVLFAVVFLLLPDGMWGGNERISSFWDAFYFSVVTITSLGFGDIYPLVGSCSRILVSIEAVLGIMVIGFFLNDIAHNQAVLMDLQNKETDEEKKAKNALEGLQTFLQILRPVFDRYLRGVYMMVTPMEEKFNMPKDIFHYQFDFQFKDLSNIYDQTILMSSDYSELAISAHFKDQNITFEELRYFVTNADLSYWSDMQKMIYEFMELHNKFQLQDIIIKNNTRVMGDGKRLGEYLSAQIANMDKMPEFTSGNVFSPYVALYSYTKESVALIQGIYAKMLEAIE